MSRVAYIIMAALLATVSSSGQGSPVVSPILCEGGEGSWVVVARWPVYDYFTYEGIDVHIMFPSEGETYYSNTWNLTANVSDASAVCRYRIDDNAWNSYSCSGGFCREQVTFPGGDVVVTVSCSSGSASGVDSVSFHVYSRGGGGERWAAVPLILSYGTLFFILLLDENNKRSTAAHGGLS